MWTEKGAHRLRILDSASCNVSALTIVSPCVPTDSNLGSCYGSSSPIVPGWIGLSHKVARYIEPQDHNSMYLFMFNGVTLK